MLPVGGFFGVRNPILNASGIMGVMNRTGQRDVLAAIKGQRREASVVDARVWLEFVYPAGIPFNGGMTWEGVRPLFLLMWARLREDICGRS